VVRIGDMKYVILKLVKDKPRHGYEVMKELEDQMHGCYSPSPGRSTRPAVARDEGLVVAQDVEGKKVLRDHPTRGASFSTSTRHGGTTSSPRGAMRWTAAARGAMGDVNRSLGGRLCEAVYRAGWKRVTRPRGSAW